jgi:plastocyanin
LRLKTRDLVIAAACGIAVGVPALAYGRADPVVTINATGTDPDYAWDQTDVTIAPGDTVKFSNQQTAASAFHNVTFSADKPTSCTQTSGNANGNVPGGPMPNAPRKGWTGECRFDAPGTYQFLCGSHPYMTGTIRVVAAATPTPTATATPGASPTPTPTPGPGGGTGGPKETQTSLAGAVTLAKSQTGTRVRGSVQIKLAGSRLEVSLWAPRKALSGGSSSKPVRIGRTTRASAPAGTVSFAVGTDAKARSALRRHRRLSVTVSIALTPPGGHKLTRSMKSTLRMG